MGNRRDLMTSRLMTNGCRRRRLRCRHPRAPLSEGGSGGDGRCQRSWWRHPTVRSAHHRSRRLEHHWASARAPLSESEGGRGSRLRSERRGPCSYEGVLCCPDWCLFINACPSDRMLPKRRVGCGIKPTSVQFEAQPQTSMDGVASLLHRYNMLCAKSKYVSFATEMHHA